ncbi:uncharacterized protein LOC126579215 [Anopheles aquasalis]|uniref:uncharacterized protein LOC126579215 n=1 Tax=Anopheles aquasalis TaxID=42839 RepID=UPI00215ACFE2|nr:uncharacterized protein LOC126579215 [Anopheles aquasalis]
MCAMALPVLSATPGTVSGVVWMNHRDHILNTYRAIYESGEYTDCILVLADGALQANSTVLGMASAFLERVFAGASLAASTGQLAVSIPDVTTDDMQQILLFIHTGEVNLRPCHLSSFVEACSLLELRGIKASDGNMMGLAISGSNIVTPQQQADEPLIDLTSTEEPQCLSELWFQDSETELDTNPPDPDPVLHDHESHITSADETEKIDIEMNALAGATLETIANYDLITAQESHHMEAEEPSTEGKARHSSLNEPKISGYEERLQAAVDAIANERLSYRKAARAFKIPTTVLWRRAHQILRAPIVFEPPAVRQQAMEAIKAGAKLLRISRQFDIPLATLHRDKQRLYDKGMLPASVTVRQRKDRPDEDQRLLEAAQLALNGTLSLRQASQSYSLSRTTIWRKVQELKDPASAQGAPQLSKKKKMPKRKAKNNQPKG